MLKLYGFPVSNYYNMVKVALLEKAIVHETVTAYPSQESDYLVNSPMGKIPYIETEEGFLTETIVILEYLEERYPTVSLYPEDPYARAKVRELIKHLELYVELPARRILPNLVFGGEVNPRTIQSVKKQLERGLPAVHSLMNVGEYIAGDQLTYADIFAAYTLSACNIVTQKLYSWDVTADIPGVKEWYERIFQREHFKSVEKDFVEGLKQKSLSL